MKRKNLEIKKENSKKLENSLISNISFFSNNKKERISMNIEVNSIYKIGERTFTSLDEANEYLVEEMISKGAKWVIENKGAVISALQKIGNPVATSIPISRYSNVGKGNLEGIGEMLKGKYHVRRDENQWPVYHFHNDEEYHIIRFTGKVWELYNLVQENIADLSPIFKRYGK